MGRHKTRDTIPVAFRLLRDTKWEIEGYAERHGMTQAAVVEFAVSSLITDEAAQTEMASVKATRQSSKQSSSAEAHEQEVIYDQDFGA